jgi:hypothetical protein
MAFGLCEVYLCDYLWRSDHPSAILAAHNLLKSSFSLALFVTMHRSFRKWAMGMGGGEGIGKNSGRIWVVDQRILV